MASHNGRVPRWLRLEPRQWLLIVVLVLITAGAAFWLQSEKPKSYEGTATVLFRSAALDQTLFGSRVFGASGDPQRDASTNLQLISTIELAERVIKAGGIALAPVDLLERVSVGNLGPSDLAGITYRSDSPEDAARVANLLATEFVALRREVNRGAIEEAITVARTRVDELRDLGSSDADLAAESRRLDDLQVLAALQTGNVEVTNPATPRAEPVGASPAQVAVRAAVLQSLLLVGLFSLFRRLRDPVDDADDLEELQIPLLAELPRARKMEIGQEAGTSEAFESGLRLLLGNLRFVAPASQSTVIVFQSTISGEGKSTVAFHLTRVAARGGMRVCIVDADLRSRSLTKGAGDPEGPGFSTLLTDLGSVDTSEANRLISESLVVEGGLALLGSGPQPPNPGDLLARGGASQIIDALRPSFDLIIVDAPPLMVVSDVTGLLQSADGVLVVVGRRVGRLNQVAKLIDRLRLLGATPVGTVLNFAPRDDSAAYYYTGDSEPNEQTRRRKIRT